MVPPPPDLHERDLRLVRDALAGERGAVGELVRRMKVVHRLLKVQNRRLGNSLDDGALDDVAQDATVLIWRKLAEYEGRAALESWIYRFCFLELMNAVRHQRRRPVLDLDLVAPPAAPERETAGEGNGLARYLRHLSKREAQIVRLRHLEELSFDEVSETLAISASSAKTYYYRALDKLRSLVEEAS